MVNLIIPVYKARATLERALYSLLAQTTNRFLVTIVIDGEDDDYADIINPFRDRGLHITVLKLAENHGAGYARQYAMDYDASRPASCEYYMFLDADDILYPIAIELLHKEIRKENADILIASFVRQVKGEFREYNAETTAITWMHGKIYRAQYLRDNNIRFLDDLRFNEDSYFNVVAVNCAPKVSRMPVPVYLWCDNPNSVTQTKEGGTFFARSNTNYIHGQLMGMRKIHEIKGSVPEDTFAQTLLYIYYAMQQQEFEGVQDYSYVDELTALKEEQWVQDFFADGMHWIKIVNTVKAGAIIDDENIIFYKLPFSDWAQAYLIKEQKVRST